MIRPIITPAFASLLIALCALLLWPGAARLNAEESARNASSLNQSLNLTMEDFGDEEGFTLKTVRTQRVYHFTRPKGWKMRPETAVLVHFQHSPALLPERSSLNILVNHRILKSIELGDKNVTPTQMRVPIPVDILKDHNTLEFQVDQHYTYKCEDPFSTELWTTLLPETKLHLAYDPKPIQPNLAHFPYPFFDELGYGKTTMGYLLPEETVSDTTLEAAAVVSTIMGQHVDWRELHPSLANEGGVKTNQNLIIIGTPAENPAITDIADQLPISLSTLDGSGKFVHPDTGDALEDAFGVLQAIPNPYHPDKAILIVSGNSPDAVGNAARLLAQTPSNQILVGQYAIIQEQNKGPIQPFRAWEGYIQQIGATSFESLGLDTLTTRGITALPLFYSLRKMPDVWIPAEKNVRVKTIYSYSSQLDPTQSKLEVRLNGTPLAAVPLDKHEGENQAELEFDIPAPDFFTYNDLEYKFHLFPEKFDMCNFVTDVHIWGTVHNSSVLDVPGRIKAPLPDVGLLNDGAFPFTVYQDLSEVTLVLPQELQAIDLETLLNITARFGRMSKTRTGINLAVRRPDSLTGDHKGSNNLIVIGPESRNKLIGEFKSKMKLLIENESASIEGPLATLEYTPDQGIIEELLSPWNDTKVALLVSGQTATALKRTSKLFASDQWFGRIKPGNLMVINGDGPKSLTFLKRGEARFIKPEDYSPGPKVPTWVWVILGIFTFLGFLSVLRFFFGRPSA